ncbi:EKC/KEOPS complex subunit TPRKB-like [Harmonia axyridis]|uniref:EKC/KEOPS complex subunit TPRKB-like n=1 Tax=Harmonia axyridis TaxID=115357 RepID=UPI001E275C3B|nr:EKC/KEOPS complex subunit TPRKB-like [Harmonia axyridis]
MNWQLDLDPSTNSKIYMHLYKNVKNAEDIVKKLIEGKLKCSAIKPSLIVDPFQVVVAANKASTAKEFKTKTVYSEILFNLSISKNITASLKTFGASDGDKDLLIVLINKINEAAETIDFINGEEVNVNRISELTDVSLVKKNYKIGEEEFQNNDLLDSVVSRIAIK